MGRKAVGFVEVHGGSIRVGFTYQGERCREVLRDMPPTAKNIKAAEDLLGEINGKIKHGVLDYATYFPDSKRAAASGGALDGTLGALLDKWLKAQGQKSPATKDQYGTAVRFWKSLLGEQALVRRLAHVDLVAKIGDYAWPSPKTYNNYMIALRGALALEFRGKKAGDNPANGVKNLKVVKRLPDPLAPKERDQVLGWMRGRYPDQVVAYFDWQFFTGMRPEETIALRWSDIDWQAMTIRVQRVRTFKGSERDGSKTHVVRDVDLLPQALDALALMKPYTFMLRVQRKGDDDTAADIFQHPVLLQPWHDERSQRDTYWRPALKALGIRWRTAYNTRHTFASAALMASAPPAYIAAQLGHSVKMLLEKYAKWIPGADGGSARAALAAAFTTPPVEARLAIATQ